MDGCLCLTDDVGSFDALINIDSLSVMKFD